MLKILFILTILLECVTVPMFLKYYWPNKCKQSMLFKMLSASLFVLCGFLAMKISGNNTPYATLMIVGLIFGWLGDLFLHWLKSRMVIFAVGLVAFLTGHIFYIIAFQKAIEKTYPGAAVLTWYEILMAIAVVGGIFIMLLVKNKIKGQELMVFGAVVYGLILITMLTKAARFVIGEVVHGTNDHMVGIFFTILVAAILFVTSDLLLGYIIGFKKDGKRILRIINILTYFPAQILLACSIFFVQ